MGIQRAYYAIIPANVRYDKTLTPNAKLLYGEITALCNEKGFCWANNEYFSELYGVSKTSISKWISSLIERGYLQSEIIYKEGSKEILNRYLRIVKDPIEEKLNTYLTKVKDPIEEKLNTPIEEKLKDNNTSSNITLKEINKESFSEEDLALWFSKVYEIYPRKVSKVKAKEMFERKLRGLDKETAYKKAIAIYRMLERQVEIWESEKRETNYLPYPASWLNDNIENSPHFKKGRKM